jgi:hypothetical protein
VTLQSVFAVAALAAAEAWTAALEPSGECRVGRPAAALVRIAARAGYHVNLEYPTVFKPAGSPGVDFGKERISLGETLARTPCADQPRETCAVSSPLAFTARAKGRVRVAGTVAFSVCNPERCLIEKVPLSLVISAK